MQKLWIWTSKSMPDLWFSAVFWIVLRVLEDLLELKRPFQGYLIIYGVTVNKMFKIYSFLIFRIREDDRKDRMLSLADR